MIGKAIDTDIVCGMKFGRMNTTVIEVARASEGGPELPSRGSLGRSWKYPWKELNPGDSFFVPGRTIKAISAMSCNRSKMDGRKYACRTENGGVRVWRIA
jgi:hypothetical protein